ncbi:MAG: right-handed parallel beta-helix repeat-containing protein [Fibrobacteria bacterium]|nr:right-handed parallel beta-helix repeat-containing protein [Fibrobacteria bacterium]
MKSFSRISLLCLCCLNAHAATVFYSPNGGGDQSGVDRSNPKPATDVNTTLNTKIGAGDTVFLMEGVYNQLVLTLSSSGSLQNPKVLTGDGWSKTILKSDWNPSTPSTSDSKNNQAIRLQSGASHWILSKIGIRNYATAIKIANDSTNTAITLDSVWADSTRDAFWIEKANRVQVLNSRATRYTKKGFRLQDDVQEALFENCDADATGDAPDWADLTESIVMGFFINANDSNISDVTFRNCIARNNLQNGQTGYKNGDGFCSERFSRRIRFVGCKSYDNQDGGFDLKGDSIRIDSSISFRNYRNYRLWSGTISVTNSIGGYARGAGLWAGNNSTVRVEKCTFADNLQAFQEDNGVIVGTRNILWQNPLGDGLCTDCPTNDPEFSAPDSLWTGIPATAFNSGTWGESYGFFFPTRSPPTQTRSFRNLSASPIDPARRNLDLLGRPRQTHTHGNHSKAFFGSKGNTFLFLLR